MTYLLIIVNVYYLKNSLRTYVQRLLKLALVQLIAKQWGCGWRLTVSANDTNHFICSTPAPTDFRRDMRTDTFRSLPVTS